jgi:tetratricopeptide (TPR) repeat protein
MRHFQFTDLTVLIAASVAFLLASPLPASAQSELPKPSLSGLSQTADPLDALFAELKREPDATQAKRISERIWARWRDSGSATANLLLQWADKAMEDEKNGLALDLLDQVVVLMPDFAEGWNRRATLHYAMGNHSKSMADINRVLTLEPRHFGAMAGMAAILDASGNDALALRAWEQMLEIYPANHQAQAKVGELADKLAGSKT